MQMELNELAVVNAVDGVTYSVQLDARAVVDVLRQELAKKTLIPVDDQILLYGPPFSRLDPRKTIESYNLFQDKYEIYVYDRRLLSIEKPICAEIILQPQIIEMPSAPPPSSSSSKLLSESISPMLKAFPGFEELSLQYREEGNALEIGGESRLQACEQCVNEQHAQMKALNAAFSNLETFLISMNKHFSSFWTEFEAIRDENQLLLDSFSSYIDALRKIQLHPALVTPSHQTLLDCIPLDREHEWHGQCKQSFSHMQLKMEQLEKSHQKLSSEVSNELVLKANVLENDKLIAINSQLQYYNQKVTSQKEMAQTLRTSYDEIVEIIADVSEKVNSEASQMSNSVLLSGPGYTRKALFKLDEIWNDEEKVLPEMKQIDDELKQFMQVVASQKMNIFQIVHGHLYTVAMFQSQIRDFENVVGMMRDALALQKRQFTELEHLKQLPEAYQASLYEINRRRNYGLDFTNKIQEMGETLSQLREDEVKHRQEFLLKHGQHLPRDFIPGLAEKPSHCDIRMRPFDQNLPLIEDIINVKADIKDKQNETSKADIIRLEQTTVIISQLKERCAELESELGTVQNELSEKKQSCCCGSQASFCSKSSSLISDIETIESEKVKDKQVTNFPLVLAMAATAGGMTSSSESNAIDIMDPSKVDEAQKLIRYLEQQLQEKDLIIAKQKIEHEQYLLNAASFEEDLQVHINREKRLEESISKLQSELQLIEAKNSVQFSGLIRIISTLKLNDRIKLESFQSEDNAVQSLNVVENRISELLTQNDSVEYLRQSIIQLENEKERLNNTKISFRSFQVNDIALFLPTFNPKAVPSGPKMYLAFHVDCPNQILSDESLSSFYDPEVGYPAYIVGRIVFIDQECASERSNPYNMDYGTTYSLITVTSLLEN